MCLKNLDVAGGLVNGARGVVTGMVANATSGGGRLWPEVKFACGVTQVMTPEVWSVMEGDAVIAERKQVPLSLAWAVSVHKCQGMTLDRVWASLSGAFDHGMVYVALSRVKSLEGLRLQGFAPSKATAHPAVVAFYRSLGCLPPMEEADTVNCMGRNSSLSSATAGNASDQAAAASLSLLVHADPRALSPPLAHAAPPFLLAQGAQPRLHPRHAKLDSPLQHTLPSAPIAPDPDAGDGDGGDGSARAEKEEGGGGGGGKNEAELHEVQVEEVLQAARRDPRRDASYIDYGQHTTGTTATTNQDKNHHQRSPLFHPFAPPHRHVAAGTPGMVQVRQRQRQRQRQTGRDEDGGGVDGIKDGGVDVYNAVVSAMTQQREQQDLGPTRLHAAAVAGTRREGMRRDGESKRVGQESQCRSLLGQEHKRIAQWRQRFLTASGPLSTTLDAPASKETSLHAGSRGEEESGGMAVKSGYGGVKEEREEGARAEDWDSKSSEGAQSRIGSSLIEQPRTSMHSSLLHQPPPSSLPQHNLPSSLASGPAPATSQGEMHERRGRVLREQALQRLKGPRPRRGGKGRPGWRDSEGGHGLAASSSIQQHLPPKSDFAPASGPCQLIILTFCSLDAPKPACELRCCLPAFTVYQHTPSHHHQYLFRPIHSLSLSI
jgi:hypothetical protein